jgi:hypothetical protein
MGTACMTAVSSNNESECSSYASLIQSGGATFGTVSGCN